MDRLEVLFNHKFSYNIVFSFSFNDFSEEIQFLEVKNKKICIITDEKVESLYLNELKGKIECKNLVSFTIPVGEKSKNLDTIKNIYDFLVHNEFHRNDLLIALGGGVVGDITGFVAATYLRGIDYVQVPTTLLAQTDSSIGGKTGVDLDGYKNLIGSFKMPKLVYINVNVLKTLEDRQYFSGFSEVMKYGLIKDANFFEWLIENMYEICERNEEILLKMIKRSCEIKKIYVEKDPLEKGDRAILNFGHTIGHAIEKAKNFTLLHGECVSLGCVAAAFISWKKQLLSMDEYYEIRDMFVPFYLPISIDGIDPNEIVSLTKADKKMDTDFIKFILLKKIGKAVIDTTVTEQEILDAVNEIYFSEEDAYE